MSTFMEEDWFQAWLPVWLPIARGTIPFTAYVTTITEDNFPSCTATDSTTTLLAAPITIGTGLFQTHKDIVIIIHHRSEINHPSLDLVSILVMVILHGQVNF